VYSGELLMRDYFERSLATDPTPHADVGAAVALDVKVIQTPLSIFH
jgi:hypothetical protein